MVATLIECEVLRFGGGGGSNAFPSSSKLEANSLEMISGNWGDLLIEEVLQEKLKSDTVGKRC